MSIARPGVVAGGTAARCAQLVRRVPFAIDPRATRRGRSEEQRSEAHRERCPDGELTFAIDALGALIHMVQGEAVVPRLLPDTAPGETAPEEPLADGEAAALGDMMRAVVTEGSATFLSAVPCVRSRPLPGFLCFPQTLPFLVLRRSFSLPSAENDCCHRA